MARRAPSVRLTYGDYEHFPDDKRYELIDGEAFVVPSPNRRHQDIVRRLIVAISVHLERHPLGHVYPAPFDVVLSDTDVLQPDVLYVADEDGSVLTDVNVRGAPTWVVEVLSPGTRHRDLTLKRQAYERAGVPEVWFIDPESDTVTVLVLRDGRYEQTTTARPPQRLRPGSIPDLHLALDDLLR